MTYSVLAPTIVPTISQGPRSSIFSPAKPSRRPRRLAVQSPTKKAVATITPYQVTVNGPAWKTIGCTRTATCTMRRPGSNRSDDWSGASGGSARPNEHFNSPSLPARGYCWILSCLGVSEGYRAPVEAEADDSDCRSGLSRFGVGSESSLPIGWRPSKTADGPRGSGWQIFQRSGCTQHVASLSDSRKFAKSSRSDAVPVRKAFRAHWSSPPDEDQRSL